jgi:hypothetical protein
MAARLRTILSVEAMVVMARYLIPNWDNYRQSVAH